MARKRQFRAARILERITGGALTTVNRMKQRVGEAFSRGVSFRGDDEPPPSSPMTKNWGFRPYGRGKTRDVSEVPYQEAIEIVWKQFCGNPVARRLNLLRRDLILDTEIRPEATDEGVQEVIDRFWDDPVNAMGTFVFQFGLQQGIFGTQCFPAFVSIEESAKEDSMFGSGLVRLGYLDPALIDDIVLDPDNARVPLAVVEDCGTDPKRIYRVIHVDLDENSPTYGRLMGVRKRVQERGSSTRDGGQRLVEVEGFAGPVLESDVQWVVDKKVERKADTLMRVSESQYKAVRISEFEAPNQVILRKGGSYEWEDEKGVPYDGACFLFRVNNVMNSKYGWPDTWHLVDWLDQADMFFFDVAERIFFLTLFVWDVMYEGLEQDEIDEKVRLMPTPSRGAIRGHNESVKWEASTPDLQQVDIETAARMLLYFIASIGFAVPETWLGASQTTRFAGAKEAVAPARKVLEARQSYIQAAIKMMVRFQIDQAIRAKRLPEDVDTSFTVQMPEISKEEVTDLAKTFKVVAEGLMIALAMGAVKQPTAVKVIHKIIDAMGVDVDPSELEKLSLEEVREMRQALMILREMGEVEIGEPQTLKDLLSGSEVTEEDLERIQREWREFLRIAGIEEEET